MSVRDVVVKCEGRDHIVKDVPLTHVVKHKSYVSKMENLAEILLKLEKVRMQSKYSCSPMAKRLLGAAAALSPQISLYKLSFMIPLIIASHYENAGVTIDLKKLCSSCPCANSLKEFLIDVAVDSVIKLRNELDGNHFVYLMFDKGQNDNLCKRLAWFSKEDRIQRTVLLDVDKAGSSSKSVTTQLLTV